MPPQSLGTKQDPSKRVLQLLPVEPDGLRFNEICKELGETDGHHERVQRILRRLLDDEAIVIHYRLEKDGRDRIYCRPSISVVQSDVLAMSFVERVVADGMLMATKMKGEERSRVVKHLIHVLLLELTCSGIHDVRVFLDQALSEKGSATSVDSIYRPIFQRSKNQLYHVKKLFRSDLEEACWERWHSARKEEASELRNLVGLMKRVKPRYRSGLPYFVKNWEQATPTKQV